MGKICAFIGQQDCPSLIDDMLPFIFDVLISMDGVTMFYVGITGLFDLYVHGYLHLLERMNVKIDYAIAMAGPVPREPLFAWFFRKHIAPEGVEQIPPQNRISWTEEWMMLRADYIVTYFTGDPYYKPILDKAKSLGKTIINLADMMETI